MEKFSISVFGRTVFGFARKIVFDPEGSIFCIDSKDKDVLADFMLRFKKACEDKPFILDLFSRAELD